MSRLASSFVLGYHGCERKVGLEALHGDLSLLHSPGSYHWLGTGSYFWENDPERALWWAREKASRGEIKEPFVIGAIIDLRNCLDLRAREGILLAKDAYESLAAVREKANLPMPKNKSARKDKRKDKVLRYLDCAVIDHLHSIIEQSGGDPFDTVRGFFIEGDPIYEGGELYEKTHSEIAVRTGDCILGIFLPPTMLPLAEILSADG